MRQDDFIGQQFYWFTGEVEDVKDPKKMNRVRVRCHGYHGPIDKCPTEDLPWATVMMPSTSQSSKGFGRTHELELGSWVVGFFRDGMSCQDPLVMGSIATMTGDTIDIPEEASGDDNYPNNKVYKSEGGHIIEIDNGVYVPEVPEVPAVEAVEASEGVEAVAAVDAVPAVPASRSGERIHIQHTNGTSATLEENNNLTVSVQSGGNLTITVNEGNTSINTVGDTTITSTGDCLISSAGSSRLRSNQKVTIEATDLVRIE